MFRRTIASAILILSCAAPAVALDLNWDRLDRLMQREGWVETARSDTYRRTVCKDCGGIEITISVSTLSPELKSEYTAREAYRAYRIKKCRTLVQSGQGRCINETGLADIGDGQYEYESVLFYGGKIIWGHTKGPSENETLRQNAEPYTRQLMKSMTPLY